MASRTKLLSVQAYDSDGGLDYCIHGSDWLEWYRWRAQRTTRAELKAELMAQFEACVDRALDMKIEGVTFNTTVNLW